MPDTSPIAPYRQAWRCGFPNVVLQATLGSATKQPDYAAAKAGDIQASYRLAKALVNDEKVAELERIIGNLRPVLIPVHAEESVSINRIPLAYAYVMGERLRLPVELNIVQAAKVSRTGADGFTRLAWPPPFYGEPEDNSGYGIVLVAVKK